MVQLIKPIVNQIQSLRFGISLLGQRVAGVGHDRLDRIDLRFVLRKARGDRCDRQRLHKGCRLTGQIQQHITDSAIERIDQIAQKRKAIGNSLRSIRQPAQINFSRSFINTTKSLGRLFKIKTFFQLVE